MTYSGQKGVESWITHIRNYLITVPEDQALVIAVSYLGGAAHEWWIARCRDGTPVQTLSRFLDMLKERFGVINKTKLARDKLHKWRQMKDVSTYNEDFLKIILDIPNISKDEQIDRYTRGLKHFIFREMCTRDYETLVEAMKDAERIESGHHRSPIQRDASNWGHPNNNSRLPRGPRGAMPMEIGNVKLHKLSNEERERCVKLGLCFRCRQKRHRVGSKFCPKDFNRN